MTRNTNSQLSAKRPVFKLRSQLKERNNKTQFTVTQWTSNHTLQITLNFNSLKCENWRNPTAVCKKTRTRFKCQAFKVIQVIKLNERIKESRLARQKLKTKMLPSAAGPVLIQHWHPRTGYLQSKLDKHSALNRFRLHSIIQICKFKQNLIEFFYCEGI